MRSIPQFAHASIREYLAARKASGDEEAARILGRITPGAAPPKPRAPGRTKEERRQKRNENMAAIRTLVMERAGERCEWCGAQGMVLEVHHTISGPSRRSSESVETCAAICADCHRGVHRGDVSTLHFARAWAVRHDYVAARSAIERRWDKIERLRATPSVPIKVVVSGKGRP